jgi:hypothetical protein
MMRKSLDENAQHLTLFLSFFFCNSLNQTGSVAAKQEENCSINSIRAMQGDGEIDTMRRLNKKMNNNSIVTAATLSTLAIFRPC